MAPGAGAGSWTAGLEGSRDTGGGAGAGCWGVCSRDCCCDRAMLDARRGDDTRDAGCEYGPGEYAALRGGLPRTGTGRSSRLGGLLDRGRYDPPLGPVGGVLLKGERSRGKRSRPGGDLDRLTLRTFVSQAANGFSRTKTIRAYRTSSLSRARSRSRSRWGSQWLSRRSLSLSHSRSRRGERMPRPRLASRTGLRAGLLLAGLRRGGEYRRGGLRVRSRRRHSRSRGSRDLSRR